MKRIFSCLRGVVLVCLCLSGFEILPAYAGDPAKKEPHLGGHSLAGEVFNEGPRQAAKLIRGTGLAHLPLSTKSAEAQKFFDQGLGQLYGFWNYEAERSFRQASKFDPNNPMPFWGMAMANTVFAAGSPKRAVGFVKEMNKRAKNANEYEREWVDGLADVYSKGANPTKALRQTWADSFAEIRKNYAGDTEAAAFEVLIRWENSALFGSKIEAEEMDQLLTEVFEKVPLHPAHHFRIHLWDGRDSKRALESAQACGPSAPGVAHMWHMPGHIYAELGRVNDAAWHQEASARVDHAYMKTHNVMPYEIHNYAHNNEWAVRSLVYAGAGDKALRLAKNLVEIPTHPKKNPVDEGGSVASYGTSRLRTVIRTFGLWEEGKKLLKTPYLNFDPDTTVDIYELTFLSRLYLGLKDAVAFKKFEDRVLALKIKGKDFAELLDEVKIHRALFDNKTKEAADLISLHAEDRDFDYLVPELLAAQKTDLALTLTKGKFNEKTPKVLFPPRILALHAALKKEETKRVFDMLRVDSLGVDLTSPLFKTLGPVAKELGYPDDWRLADIGFDFRNLRFKNFRGSSEKLGPLTWTPNNAPGFKLMDSTSKEWDLADFTKQQKPVLVVFYLGSQCLKCVEQLKTLIPEVEKFEKAGISILAIGTDSPDQLADWDAKLKNQTGKGFPFPMLSDKTKHAFKAFGAYDDFEEFPLHGLFLVDGKGKLRWQEISADPFTDFKFLLAESTRLLAISQ